MSLTAVERRNHFGNERLKSISARLHAATKPILASFYAFPVPKRQDYYPALAIQEYNKWVDRQYEKKLADIQAKREAVKTAEDAAIVSDLLGIQEHKYNA